MIDYSKTLGNPFTSPEIRQVIKEALNVSKIDSIFVEDLELENVMEEVNGRE